MTILYSYGANNKKLSQEMVALTNVYRRVNNKRELLLHDLISRIANEHAAHMCRTNRLTHESPGGSLKKRLVNVGFDVESIGENIAQQENDDYEELARMWMKSKLHRNNILGNFEYTDAATCRNGKNRYWIQIFGKLRNNEEKNDDEIIEEEDKEFPIRRNIKLTKVKNDFNNIKRGSNANLNNYNNRRNIYNKNTDDYNDEIDEIDGGNEIDDSNNVKRDSNANLNNYNNRRNIYNKNTDDYNDEIDDSNNVKRDSNANINNYNNRRNIYNKNTDDSNDSNNYINNSNDIGNSYIGNIKDRGYVDNIKQIKEKSSMLKYIESLPDKNIVKISGGAPNSIKNRINDFEKSLDDIESCFISGLCKAETSDKDVEEKYTRNQDYKLPKKNIFYKTDDKNINDEKDSNIINSNINDEKDQNINDENIINSNIKDQNGDLNTNNLNIIYENLDDQKLNCKNLNCKKFKDKIIKNMVVEIEPPIAMTSSEIKSVINKIKTVTKVLDKTITVTKTVNKLETMKIPPVTLTEKKNEVKTPSSRHSLFTVTKDVTLTSTSQHYVTVTITRSIPPITVMQSVPTIQNVRSNSVSVEKPMTVTIEKPKTITIEKIKTIPEPVFSTIIREVDNNLPIKSDNLLGIFNNFQRISKRHNNKDNLKNIYNKLNSLDNLKNNSDELISNYGIDLISENNDIDEEDIEDVRRKHERKRKRKGIFNKQIRHGKNIRNKRIYDLPNKRVYDSSSTKSEEFDLETNSSKQRGDTFENKSDENRLNKGEALVKDIVNALRNSINNNTKDDKLTMLIKKIISPIKDKESSGKKQENRNSGYLSTLDSDPRANNLNDLNDLNNTSNIINNHRIINFNNNYRTKDSNNNHIDNNYSTKDSNNNHRTNHLDNNNYSTKDSNNNYKTLDISNNSNNNYSTKDSNNNYNSMDPNNNYNSMDPNNNYNSMDPNNNSNNNYKTLDISNKHTPRNTISSYIMKDPANNYSTKNFGADLNSKHNNDQGNNYTTAINSNSLSLSTTNKPENFLDSRISTEPNGNNEMLTEDDLIFIKNNLCLLTNTCDIPRYRDQRKLSGLKNGLGQNNTKDKLEISNPLFIT